MADATDVDVRPKVMNIAAYAGSTLKIKVTVPAGVADNFIWEAHIKKDRSVPGPPDAVFEITEPTVPGNPAYLILPAAESTRLASTGSTVTRRNAKAGTVTVVQTYSGQWDCQAKHPVEPDPSYTFVQGAITFDLDVTR